MTPSVYEMAALTQDLDTQIITTKIKEALLANNIGQKVSMIAVFKLKLNQMECSDVTRNMCSSHGLMQYPVYMILGYSPGRSPIFCNLGLYLQHFGFKLCFHYHTQRGRVVGTH
jgi:hypothetical protein